jgi:aldose 1-epimerase
LPEESKGEMTCHNCQTECKIQVYAPPQKNFFAIEPQFNLPDPYNKDWGSIDTGMVLLQPGQAVSWRVRLELFTPSQ